ncbi:hypothetical protein H4217_001193 [Coemansia sp. RSA 1939]|nr:hypothetical protein H4217_001193 [Coemansia sp. RSA 1939]KAJ2682938.1 hypothetical protein GGH99_004542 [Coemansia sp. RSA 1285]
MNNPNNIMAIPSYPPLPQNVSGVFPSVEQRGYAAAQKNGKGSSPVASALSSEAQDNGWIPQRPRFAQFNGTGRQYPYASYEVHHARHAGRPRSNSGYEPTTAGNASPELPRANVSNVRASLDFSSSKPLINMRPSLSFGKGAAPSPHTLPRRSSVISHSSSSTSSENLRAHGRYLHSSPHSSVLELPTVPSGAKRVRHDSIASDASTSLLGKFGGSQSGERKYVCDWQGCVQAFDRVEHLNRHMRRHTGEKPYCCLVARCSKLFSRFDNMMQHVGIHNIEGAKTEIPNIKNLSFRGNGRGRARRTSYRGIGDAHEKFRRHVEGALGTNLADSCILPTENPDFSNLTLRPLLNAEPDLVAGSQATPEPQQQLSHKRNDSLPLQLLVSGVKPSPAALQQQQQQAMDAKRLRHDSVVDGMETHVVPSLSTAAVAAAAKDSNSGLSQQHHATSLSAKSEDDSSPLLNHRNSLGLVPSMSQISNVRGKPDHSTNA